MLSSVPRISTAGAWQRAWVRDMSGPSALSANPCNRESWDAGEGNSAREVERHVCTRVTIAERRGLDVCAGDTARRPLGNPLPSPLHPTVCGACCTEIQFITALAARLALLITTRLVPAKSSKLSSEFFCQPKLKMRRSRCMCTGVFQLEKAVVLLLSHSNASATQFGANQLISGISSASCAC